MSVFREGRMLLDAEGREVLGVLIRAEEEENS